MHRYFRSILHFSDTFTSKPRDRTLSVGCNSNSDVYDSLTRVDENGDPVKLSCHVFASEYDDFETNDPNWDESNPDFNLLNNLDARQMAKPRVSKTKWDAASIADSDILSFFCLFAKSFKK